MSAEIIIMSKILSLTACEILETYYREKILCSFDETDTDRERRRENSSLAQILHLS